MATLNKNLYKSIEKSEVISFDIFDTLLVRGVLNPEDVFFIMEEGIKNILQEERTLLFRKIRVSAEKKAKEKKVKEVTLDDIYEIIKESHNLTLDQTNQIKELELTTETRLLYPRKIGQELYNLAKDLKKDIIIVSDMYLPKSFLKELLHKNGYDGFKHLFVSCEYGKSKHMGDLYNEVIDTLVISPKKILHIGDNYKSDIINAKRSNIKTLHLDKPSKNIRKNKYLKKNVKCLTLGDRALFSIIANKFYDTPPKSQSLLNNSYYELGYKLFSSLILGMSLDLMTFCKENEIKDVFLYQRDGFLAKTIFDKLSPYIFNKKIPKTHNLLSNRQIMNVFSLMDYPEYLIRYNYNLSISAFLHLLFPKELSIKVAASLEEQKINPRENILDVDISYLKKFIMSQLDIFDDIKNEYLAYLNNKFTDVDFSKTVFFDIGYQGTSDTLLGLLYNSSKDSIKYNMGIKEGNYLNNYRVKSYLGNDFFRIMKYPHVWLEVALSTTKSPKEIALEENLTIFSQIANSNVMRIDDINKAHEIQKGIIDAIDDVLNIYKKDISQFKISVTFIKSLLEYTFRVDHKDDILKLGNADGDRIIENKFSRNNCIKSIMNRLFS